MSEAVVSSSDLLVDLAPTDSSSAGAWWRGALSKPWVPLLLLLVGTLAVEWFSASRVYTGEMLSHILGGAGTSAPGRLLAAQLQAAGPARLIGEPIVLVVRVGIVALLLQFAMLAVRLEIPLGAAFAATSWAGLTMVAKSMARTWLLLSDPAHATPESLLTTPWSLGSYLHVGMRHGVAVRDLVDALNPFEVLWVVVLIAALARYGASKRRSAIAVITLWCFLALVRFAFAAYVAGATA